tara:strand:- start:566 stop:1465 length:900 start_codon:yes stop_codon:yes gene_type:complete
MTGFGNFSYSGERGTYSVELKSLNSRYLDLQFKINDELRFFEPYLRSKLTKYLSRGKVEFRLTYIKNFSKEENFVLNKTLIYEITKIQDIILESLPESKKMSINELLRWPNILIENKLNQENFEEDLEYILKKVIEEFMNSKYREGNSLKEKILSYIENIEKIIISITPKIPEFQEQYKQKIYEKIEDLINLEPSKKNINLTSFNYEEFNDRIKHEIMLFGIRTDVSEELTRLITHVNETKNILMKGGIVGKKLDFMMQELNREANTLGSKSSSNELSNASLELKMLIEQIREQVQNIE